MTGARAFRELGAEDAAAQLARRHRSRAGERGMPAVSEGVPPPAQLPSVQGRVEHWEGWFHGGWCERWITLRGSVVRLFEREPQPGDEPKLTVDVGGVPGRASVRVEPDPTNAERMRLDGQHLRFATTTLREEFMRGLNEAAAQSPRPRASPAPSAPVSVDEARYPRKVGKYRMGLINPMQPPPKGSFGSVWLGVNLETGAQVAAKIAHDHFEGTPEQRKEIELQASLRHANVVDVIDVVQEGGVTWTILEFLPGGELFAEAMATKGTYSNTMLRSVLYPTLS